MSDDPFLAVRETFADLLRTYDDGTNAPTEVFADEPGDLTAASPVQVLSRYGRSRERIAMRVFQTRIKVYLDTYVAASDGTTTYTPEDVAAMLDTQAQRLDAMIEANQGAAGGVWKRIDYDGDSVIEFGIFGDDGLPRYRERQGLIFTL